MTIIYADMVRTLAKPGSKIRAELTVVNAAILTAAMAIFNRASDILGYAQDESVFESDESTHVWHMSVGIAGEAGELLDVIKKLCVYNKPLTPELRDNIVEELGDLHFYTVGHEQVKNLDPLAKKFMLAEIEIIKDQYNISQDEIEAHNIKKLSKRYEALRYSDSAAIARADKVETGETESSGVAN